MKMQVLNEQALNEVFPALLALARSAPALIGRFGPAIKKGASSAAKFMKDNPEFAGQMADLVMSIKDKVPELKDVELKDANSITQALSGEQGELLLKVLQDASNTVEEEGLADESETDVDGVFEARKIRITKRQLKKIVNEALGVSKMKITKRQLKEIIKEEKAKILSEQRATAMGQTARSDELFDARDNLLGLIEMLEPNEFEPYINSLIEELEMMKQGV
tara:strand:+ start:86 stop:748 length:663 start_codon:yes stop_codon:yes gene_type:complete